MSLPGILRLFSPERIRAMAGAKAGATVSSLRLACFSHLGGIVVVVLILLIVPGQMKITVQDMFYTTGPTVRFVL